LRLPPESKARTVRRRTKCAPFCRALQGYCKNDNPRNLVAAVRVCYLQGLMTKIYEALRRHEQNRVDGESLPHQDDGTTSFDDESDRTDPSRYMEAPRQAEEARLVGQSQVVTNFFGANREMQTLYRTVEPLIARNQEGVTIMFSSAHPGEGKTTVCGSYAVTLAQSFGKSVLILDGDREHVLTRQWGSQKDVTVSALEKSAEVDAVLHTGSRIGARGSISVVPVGSGNADSPDLAMIAANKDKLAKTFNYILIDAPSIADASWSPSIGSMADGVILVVEAERTRWPVALNAKQEFEASGARVIGVFLNKRRFYIPPRIYRRM
jgi:protein-tyrosine kinase